MSALMRCSRLSQVLTTLRSSGRCLSIQWQRIQDKQHVKNHVSEKQHLLKPIGYQIVSYSTHATKSTDETSEQVTEDTVQQIEASKTNSGNVEQSQKIIRKRDLISLNKVEIPPNFPASKYWKSFKFEGEVDWKFLENQLIIMQEKADYVSTFFFNKVMRATLLKDDYSEDLAMTILNLTGRAGLKIGQKELQKWTKYLDNRFHEKEPQHNVRYYNMVLKMMLENGADFSVLEFLSRMEKYNVAPNRVTLGRCLMKYAEKGDMEAANEILEHMKTTQMPVSKKVYASIIQGHFRAGNYDTAMALFRDTKNVGFEMDSHSYHNAILGNIQANNLPVVKQLLQEAKETSNELSDASLCSLIESSAMFDKPEFCDFFIKELASVSTFHYHKAFEVLVTVLRKGYFDMGLKFFSSLTDPHPNIMMNAMCFSNMPAHQEARFLRHLKKDSEEGHTNLFIDYIGRCLEHYNYGSAIQMLPYLKEEHEKLPHMGFYPLVIYFKDHAANYAEELKKKVLPHMPVSMEMVFLLQAFWPSEGGSLLEALEKHSPLSAGQVNALRLDEALKSEGPVKAASMLSCMGNIDDIPYTVELNKRSLLAQSLSRFTGEPVAKWRDQLKFAAALKEKDVLIPVHLIVSSAMTAKVDPVEIKDELLKLGLMLTRMNLEKGLDKFDKVLTDKERKKLTEVENIDYSKMSLEELKALALFHNSKVSFRHSMLIKAGIAQDFKLVGEVLERNLNFEKSNKFLVHRIRAEYALKWKNNPMEAFTILKKCADDITVTKGLVNTVPYLVFRHSLAWELWRAGHCEEAIETFALSSKSSRLDGVEYFPNRNKDFMWFDHPPQSPDQMFRLVSAMCKADLFKIKYWRQDVLDKLLKAMNKSDLTQVLKTLPVAVELLSRTNPEVVGCIMDLFKPFLNKRADLKALFEECTKHFEEKTALVALAAVHLEVAELVKFQKIMQTPGLMLDPIMLKQVFLRWKENNPSLIEEFADLTKGLPGNVSDAKDLCELLHRCNKTDATERDVDDCVAFFNEKFGSNMTVVLRDRYTAGAYLSFLRQHGRPLPFDMDILKNPLKFKQSLRQQQQRQARREQFSETLKGEDEEGSVQLIDLLSTIDKRKRADQ